MAELFSVPRNRSPQLKSARKGCEARNQDRFEFRVGGFVFVLYFGQPLAKPYPGSWL